MLCQSFSRQRGYNDCAQLSCLPICGTHNLQSAICNLQYGRGGARMTTDNRGELIVLPTPATLAEEAARRFADLAQAAIGRSGRFTVALSGGSTPRALHQKLAQPPLSTAIDWAKILVFWGDERF